MSSRRQNNRTPVRRESVSDPEEERENFPAGLDEEEEELKELDISTKGVKRVPGDNYDQEAESIVRREKEVQQKERLLAKLGEIKLPSRHGYSEILAPEIMDLFREHKYEYEKLCDQLESLGYDSSLERSHLIHWWETIVPPVKVQITRLAPRKSRR